MKCGALTTANGVKPITLVIKMKLLREEKFVLLMFFISVVAGATIIYFINL